MNVGEDVHHLQVDSEERTAAQKAPVEKRVVLNLGGKNQAYLSYILEKMFIQTAPQYSVDFFTQRPLLFHLIVLLQQKTWKLP